MNIEEQLREYRATLDTATETAAVTHTDRLAPPVRLRPARTLLVAAVAVAAAVGLAFAAVGVTHRNSTSPAGPATSTPTTPLATVAPTTVVPNVVGMRQAQADDTLTAVGLSINARSAVSCSVPAGTVVRQSPAAGTRVASTWRVTLDVCTESGRTLVVPVVVCPTETGTPFSSSDPRAPTSLKIATPGFTSPTLSGYSDKRGFLTTTAPAGWTCRALDATDGGVAIGITPPGAKPRQSWDYGGKVIQPPTDGVFLYSDPTCGGCVFDDVCAIVPGTEHSFPGLTCPKQPAGQVVTPLGNNLYAIDDPAGALGPDPAHSILKYAPKTATSDPGNVRETCILPASQHSVCEALLNQFLALRK